jgi:hypothetical protein
MVLTAFMSTIESQLAHARSSFNERGELAYLTRVELLRSLDEAPTTTALGRGRRASLALACARECAHFWAQAGSDLELRPVLDFAQACLNERTMFAELQNVAENLNVEVDNVLGAGESHFRASYAGAATVAAARTVVRDEILDESVSSEEILAVQHWGSAFWASCAFAGGAVWEDGVDMDDEARRRFWLWYLDTAIPRAL